MVIISGTDACHLLIRGIYSRRDFMTDKRFLAKIFKKAHDPSSATKEKFLGLDRSGKAVLHWKMLELVKTRSS